MIVGIGTDVCHIRRLGRALERSRGFEERVFTQAERAFCRSKRQPEQHFAARFAAKEAVAKALGAPSGLSWQDVDVSCSSGGQPHVRLTGAARRESDKLGVTRWNLSLSHSGDVALAMVVADTAL